MVLIMQKLCLELESEVNSYISISIEISSRILYMGGFQERREFNTKMFQQIIFCLEISNYTRYL